jgi:hypothetical protein
MRARRAKKLLQIIIGAGEIGHAVAVTQARPVAPADLQQGPDRWCEAPGCGLRLPHGSEQPVQPSPPGCRRALGVIVQDRRGAMHPALGHPHRGPQGSRRVQPAPEDRLQTPEGLGHGPLFATRSRLWALALRRSGSWRPAAAKGGRPASVRALRTARP